MPICTRTISSHGNHLRICSRLAPSRIRAKCVRGLGRPPSALDQQVLHCRGDTSCSPSYSTLIGNLAVPRQQQSRSTPNRVNGGTRNSLGYPDSNNPLVSIPIRGYTSSSAADTAVASCCLAVDLPEKQHLPTTTYSTTPAGKVDHPVRRGTAQRSERQDPQTREREDVRKDF